MADNEEILSDWLTAHGVDDPWLIAPALAAAGMDVAWCEKVSTVLGEGPLGAALEWVASSVSMTALLAEVKDATHRISDLVAAVREYSQLDRASVQTINVTEGLESTLVMFGHKLRRDITVERDFDPELPRIEAIPGELNQVWTNLIANALDAMGGTGTLRLTTRVDDLGWVVVEIADTGPGMPEHLQARAFEPFFTTKEVGVGTGLGLDISRRIIVDRHSGEITIDSVPGRTVLEVRLPTRRTQGILVTQDTQLRGVPIDVSLVLRPVDRDVVHGRLRGIFGFFRGDVLDAALDGQWRPPGSRVNQSFLVASLAYILLPALMVGLSLVLRPRLNRLLNIVVSLVYAVTVIASCIGETWVYYIVGSLVEAAIPPRPIA